MLLRSHVYPYVQGIPAVLRERIGAVVTAGGKQAGDPYEARISVDPFQGNVVCGRLVAR